MFAYLLSALLAAESVAALRDARTDVPYAGPDSPPGQTLDIYPAGQHGDDHPIVLWIHGGGWRRGDKSQVQQKPQAFNRRGYALVSVNYRLQPEVDFRGQAEDVARAVAWVREHAREFGGTPDDVFLLGHSAGAHLAALVATDPTYLRRVGLDASAVRGVVLLDGAGYDVAAQYRFGGPRIRELYASAFGADEAEQREASPLAHVAAGRGTPPFLILYVAQRLDSRRQSRLLAEKLKAAGVDARAVPTEGKTHMTINRELGQPSDEPTREVFEFLERTRSQNDRLEATAVERNQASR